MHFNFLTMRKLSIASYLMLISAIAIGQVTTNGGSGMAASYPTLAAAITDLNTKTITNVSGSVVITVPVNEVAPAGGYTINVSGTISSSITIRGTNNATITASNAHTIGSLTDAIFKIIGGDFITITGFTIRENPDNTVLTPANNNMTEFGIAMFNASPTNGPQSNNISDNNISLRRQYVNSFGIYSNANHSATDPTIIVEPTSQAGRSRNFTIIRNNISNVNMGIVLVGAPSRPGDAVTIGGEVIQNQTPPINIIDNYGTSANFSNFARVEKMVAGIMVTNYTGAGGGVNIRSNQLFSTNGEMTSGTIRGIVTNTVDGPLTNILATTATTFNLRDNVVAVRTGVANGLSEGILHNYNNDNTTLNITGNNFILFTNQAANPTGDINFIRNTSPTLVQNIRENSFSGLILNTIGRITFVHNDVACPAGGTQNIVSNRIIGFLNRLGTGVDANQTVTVGLFAGSTAGSAENSIINWTDNVFSNVTLLGANTFIGIYNRDGQGSPGGSPVPPVGVTKQIANNIIGDISGATGGSFTAILVAGGSKSGGANVIRNNTIRNYSGSGTINGIVCENSPNSFYDVNGNNIFNLTSSTGTVTGISNNATTANTFQNRIYNLSGTGKTVALAIGGSTHNAHRNTIFNIINTASGNAMAAGIEASMAATGNSLGAVFNNIVGDIKTPNSTSLNGAMGLNLLGGSNTRYNVYYNTILLRDTSTGATYGNSGVHFEGTLEGVDMRNTIVINKSQPGNAAANNSANGVTAAVRRTGGTAGSTANYLATSNNNLYWANPNASINNRATWVDGTASITNLVRSVANLKTALVNRDQGSFEEDAPFFSTTLEDANYLKFETNTFTLANNNALPIAGITIDIDGEARSATTPDIGADEINFILPVGLMTFSGQRIGSDNVLSWRTSFEFNNHGFEVLRSVDGRNFEKVSYVNSLAEDGNSQVQLNYTFRDQKVNNITYFYRLRQVDFDGTSKLTSIVKIDGGPIANTLRINSVFPNPARSVVNTMVEAPGADKLNITITDMNGRVISQSVNQVDRGNNTISLPVSQLGSGLYIIRFTNQAGEVTTQRFIKQ